MTVGVVGSRIKDEHVVAADLLAAGASKSEIDQALAQAKAHPTYFDPVFQVTKARFEQLKDQPGPGNVYAVPGTQFELAGDRSALTAQLGAHVVGSVGPITAEELHHLGPPYDASSVVGQTGLEQAYERRLAGTPTTRVVVLDRAGRDHRDVEELPGSPGQAGRDEHRPDRPARRRGGPRERAPQRGPGRDPPLDRKSPGGRQRPDQLRIRPGAAGRVPAGLDLQGADEHRPDRCRPVAGVTRYVRPHTDRRRRGVSQRRGGGSRSRHSARRSPSRATRPSSRSRPST